MMMKKFILFIMILSLTNSIFSFPGKILKNFKLSHNHPTGLVYDGKYLWFADHKVDRLICIDPASGNKIREIKSPGFWPMGLAFDGKYLWNVDEKLKKIFKLDPNDGKILAAIDAPSDNPCGLAWDGKTLWTTDYREKKIMKLDLSDGTPIESFNAPANYPQDLTFDGKYLWCSDRMSDEIYMIEPKTGDVILIIKSPGPYPRGLAYDGKYLWNVDYQNDEIYQLVREDEEIYKLENERHTKITFTHEVKITGEGELKDLNVYIAIPDNLPQQKILKKEFLPEYKIIQDRFNQQFAHFNYKSVKSEATLSSTMTIEAKISEIHYYIFPDKCGKLSDIPKDIISKYTSDETKYQINDPYIKDIVKKIVGGEQNPYWIARKIFDYVRNTLEYKLEGGWNVAPFVLKRGTGSCSEYTFSFISLCRAAGLPARYVGSIVVRGDDASLDEVYHRWPEIYLPNYGWIPIDPQAGDKPLPRDQAINIGHLPNRFLITTQSGGDSEFLGWYYNSFENFITDPQVKVNVETFGEWEPIK